MKASVVSFMLLPFAAMAFAPQIRPPAFMMATRLFSSAGDDVRATLEAMKPSKPAKSKEEDIELTIKAIKALNPQDFGGEEDDDEEAAAPAS
mmetsp:Transcript_3668/g.5476  ORF Transcript_3668/g.5476 Transcript_3668/m.5476 type:complete len:92 (+) Transcript_3668:132-407(+)|eukprot:CAMPEP_0172420890 /NCGR_PEP_ID=MMETSP1064-20121228/7203_1 /TAXON_ID=202472 /ORGANISM="Aulacoseira subarctica , Strain CCAP 1002/5" /LENGTH=91 /DNA_ID=CAMNT_0013161033 /DNA_START=133 /DNA_END=408 /DNA_ORIENTATION=-